VPKRATADQIDSVAGEAVRAAGVDRVFKNSTSAKTIFEQIEKCNALVEEEDLDEADESFLSMALPIANGLIHYATSRRLLDQAEEWIKDHWSGDFTLIDPASILAALTLIYVVNEGEKYYRGQAKEKTWRRIRERIARLKEIRDIAA